VALQILLKQGIYGRYLLGNRLHITLRFVSPCILVKVNPDVVDVDTR